jgi:hypothetical protein
MTTIYKTFDIPADRLLKLELDWRQIILSPRGFGGVQSEGSTK